ncbi:MAG: heavy metal-associated domain-containing protein [Bacteroidales bacterium]
MKKHSLIMLLLLAGIFVNAQDKGVKWTSVSIKTSAQCEQCKTRIEEYLAFEPGVKKSTLDLQTKEVTVEYNTGKTNLDKLRKAITKCGYDADDQPADPKAYKKLPACCKKPGDPDAKPHGKSEM